MSSLPMSLSGRRYGEGTYGAAGYGTDIRKISHQHIRYVMTNDTINTHPDTLAARQNINNLPENGTDYVVEGCDLTVNAADELTVSRGVLVLSHDETLYRVTVGERSGDDVLDVPADSQLGVYYDIVPNEVVVQASAPLEPMLQIGSVNTAAGTTTLTNRRPDQTVELLKAGQTTNTGRQRPATVDENGVWYYHNDKTTTYDEARNQTLISYLGGSDAESIVIAAIDHDQFSWQTLAGDDAGTGLIEDIDSDAITKEVLAPSFTDDDHSPASITVLSDGRIAAAYANHNSGNVINLHFTDTTGDISTFGTGQTIDATNTHTYPIYYEQDGAHWIWFRSNFSDMTYVRSTDGGATWSGPTTAVTGTNQGRVYAMRHQDSQGRLHMTLNDTTGGYGPHEDVYYGYFKNGEFRSADGSLIGGSSSYPLGTADFDLLYDTSASGNHDTFSWDIAVDDETGDIGIVHSEFLPSNHHLYRYLRYDAAAGDWTSQKLCHGGTQMPSDDIIRFYSNAARFDGTDPDTLFVSVGNQEYSTIQKWETPDDGQTWDYTEWSDSANLNTRPRVPRNAHPDIGPIWLRGDYFGFDGLYDTSLLAAPMDRPLAEHAMPDIPSVNSGTAIIEANTSTTVSGDNSWTKVEFGETIADPFAWADDRNDPTQLEIDRNGKYRIEASVQLDSVDAGTYEAEIVEQNGYLRAALGSRSVAAGESPVFEVSRTYHVEKNDPSNAFPEAIQLRVRQDSGSAQSTVALGQATRLVIERMNSL